MAYSTLDQLQLKVLNKVVGLVMAKPNQRTEYEQFLMTVAKVEDRGEHVRRITFHAPEFDGWTTSGPDEYFGLLIPQDGVEVVLPSPERLNLRAAVHRIPAATRPHLRWYTVRAVRGTEIDVDFVLHQGSDGPGSLWAASAKPGAVVGFRACGSCYVNVPGRQLLIADETSLPALSAILDTIPEAEVTAVVEVPDESFQVPDGVQVVCRTGSPGDSLLPAIAELDMAGLEYAWICGERGMVSAVRRHLVRERGIDRKRIMFSAYWQEGQTRG